MLNHTSVCQLARAAARIMSVGVRNGLGKQGLGKQACLEEGGRRQADSGYQSPRVPGHQAAAAPATCFAELGAK